MKTFEIEITRNNVTPTEFLRYVRNRVDAKGGSMIRSDLDTAYFAAGNDLNFDIKHTAEEAAETGCIRELSVSRPYEMQTHCVWADGSKYNEICEFSFDDEKTGHGYYYLISVYDECDDAQPAQDAGNETETDKQTDAENAAEGTQNENRTREQIATDIIEYFKSNEDAFTSCIEELDAYNGYLGDDRYYDMEMLPEYHSGTDALDLLNMAFFGHDADTWYTNSQGQKEYGAFNPSRDYFTYNAYGNLVSSNYKDYSAYLDKYAVEAMAENRAHINCIDDYNELAELFDEYENAEE